MIHNTFKYSCAFVSIALSLLLVTCSLDRIDPSVKYDPCLGKVVAKFSHDQIGVSCDSPCNLSVKFTNNSTGAKSYTWEFGDGGTSTEATPTYIYKKSGRFDIKLTAKGENGCSNESIEVYTIGTLSTPNPIANFTFEYGGGNQFAPTTVNFKSTSQHENAYCWFVNDSLFSTLNNPSFTFNQPGNYTIKLVAKAGSKESPPKTQVVTINRRTFEKTLSAFGIGKKIIATADGGFIIAGKQLEMGSASNTDVYVIKVDADGNLIPTFNLPINLSSADDVSDLVMLSTGNIAIIGTTLSATGTKNILYASVDPINGTWVSNPIRYGTTTSQLIGSGGVLSSTGGWLTICGASANVGAQPDALLISRSSNQLVTPNFNDIVYPVATSAEYLYDISTTSTGGYIAIGTSNALNSALNDVLLMITNSVGAKIGLSRTFGTLANLEEANAIFKTKLGKFLVGGTSRIGSTGTGDFWLLLTDETGTAASGFPMTLGDPTVNEESKEVIELSDGSIAMVGLRGNRALFIKTNASGQLPSFKTYGSTGNQVFNSLSPTIDGGLIFVGGNGTALYLVRKDKEGN